MSWKVSATAHRELVERVLGAHEDDTIVLSGREVDEASGEWVLEAWLEDEPTPAQLRALEALFHAPVPGLAVEQLEEQDWVTLSQAGMEPIRAGRFHVRTPDHAASSEPGAIDFVIPASQAFGTGQHATTAGCLAMLDAIASLGASFRNIVDVGTGTGLLAFAAQRLWPEARVAAADIDPVCEMVVCDNAAVNGVPLGIKTGEVAVVTAPGLDHPALVQRAPYDLLIANILAGPLIELAPSFVPHVTAGGSIVLAGLLATQEDAVVDAYRQLGCELVQRNVAGDWSILWLRIAA
jgi:ribosomal protein L11 methyltransferase